LHQGRGGERKYQTLSTYDAKERRHARPKKNREESLQKFNVVLHSHVLHAPTHPSHFQVLSLAAQFGMKEAVTFGHTSTLQLFLSLQNFAKNF
jgi:hypothetical protein